MFYLMLPSHVQVFDKILFSMTANGGAVRAGSSKSVRSKSSTRSRASEDGQQQKQWSSVSEVYGIDL